MIRAETKFLPVLVMPESGLVQKILSLRDSVDFGEEEILSLLTGTPFRGILHAKLH